MTAELRSLRERVEEDRRRFEDTHARTVRPDGNSVEMESELLEMNRNTVEYNYLTEIVSGNLKQLRMAITGRSY